MQKPKTITCRNEIIRSGQRGWSPVVFFAQNTKIKKVHGRNHYHSSLIRAQHSVMSSRLGVLWLQEKKKMNAFNIFECDYLLCCELHFKCMFDMWHEIDQTVIKNILSKKVLDCVSNFDRMRHRSVGAFSGITEAWTKHIRHGKQVMLVGVSRGYTDHHQGQGHSIRPTATLINIHEHLI